MQRALEGLRTPAGRGLAIMMLTTGVTGFAMAAQGTIVSNFFEQELHLTGPQFGYITAIREIPGFLLIFVTFNDLASFGLFTKLGGLIG